MSISSGSKILASDVSGKIDTAGTGLSKNGTTLSLASLHTANSTIGSSSAQTLSYSGTFTIPYITRDTYGRVSGGGTRTITMPAAPSSSVSLSYATYSRTGTNVKTHTSSGFGSISYTSDNDGDYWVTINLASGGSWFWIHNSGYGYFRVIFWRNNHFKVVGNKLLRNQTRIANFLTKKGLEGLSLSFKP